MRLTSILFRGRQPQNENKVPFKAILPLTLRDFVSSKTQKITSGKGCLYEISLLLTCLEENEFEDKRCSPELKALDQCYKVHCENMQREHSLKEQMVPVPNSKNLTQKQITYLLRRYPTV